MKARIAMVSALVATLGLFPLSAPAQATHSCGFEPCPHPQDVVELLCSKFPVLDKLGFC
jgi:hypothetical protein